MLSTTEKYCVDVHVHVHVRARSQRIKIIETLYLYWARFCVVVVVHGVIDCSVVTLQLVGSSSNKMEILLLLLL